MGALDLDHVALPVNDARAAHRFYSEVLGLALVEALSGDEWEGRAWLMMIFADTHGRRVALCAYGGPPLERERIPTDARHYAFAARSLAPWKRRLAAARVAYREEDHGGGQRSIYFDDPSGNTLEITSPAARTVRPMRRKEALAEIERWKAA